MAVLVLSATLAIIYSLGMAFVCSKSYFALLPNKPFARSWPEIDPPLWRVALSHIAGLLSTVLWLVQWPSVTEVKMALCLLPLLIIPFPSILSNVLEWFMFLIFGNAKGDGSHRDGNNGAPPLRWPPISIGTGLATAVLEAVGRVYTWHRMMWHGTSPEVDNAVNCNHSLLSYLQNESWDEMHHLDDDVLAEFPSSSPSSRSNAVMMARCATMAYDRWHNIDQAVSCRWSNGRPNKYSLLTAWSFDRVIAPSDLERKDNITVTAVPCSCSVSLTIQLRKNLENMQCCVTRWKKYAIKYFFQFWRAVWGWAAGKPLPPLTEDDRDTTTINTDAFLLRADKVDANGEKEVALVLAFRGTEALQTVDWISDFNMITPPPTAKDPAHFPKGFTHQGFRDSLGLKRNLHGAEDLRLFHNSYLVYTPDTCPAGSGTGSTGSAGWNKGTVDRRQDNPHRQDVPDKSPFTIISEELTNRINMITQELEKPNAQCSTQHAKIKVFVTGHSLGAALAHLYSGTLLLAKQTHGKPIYEGAQKHFEAVYTFGEPRVGDQVWVQTVEDALTVAGKDHLTAEDRFKRVVNTLDIVTRIPPPLGDVYQHPGHCTLIKPHFAIAKDPADVPHWADLLIRVAKAAGIYPSFSPVTSLTETPEIFFWPTVTTVLVKLAVSVLMLASSVVLQVMQGCNMAVYFLGAVAAVVALAPGALLAVCASSMAVLVAVMGISTFIFLPGLYGAVLDPVLQQAGQCLVMLITSVAQPLKRRPRLVSNPIYVVTRLLALLGPGPIVLLLDVLLMPGIVINPFLWWAMPVEVVLLLLLFAVTPPVIFGGVIDHSMVEYYAACWVSTDTDWYSTP